MLLGPLWPFLLFVVVPLGYALFQSLHRVERIGPFGEGGSTVFAGLANYQAALTNPDFMPAFRVGLFAIVQVPIMVVLPSLSP